jgi:acyl-CoA thioesterase-1
MPFSAFPAAPTEDGLWPRLFNVALAAAAALLAALPGQPAAAEPLQLLALGDSLAAGYGLPEADGFAARLQAALLAAGHDVEVINAGVSGDTTAGGRERLAWSLADQPDLVLVELGANDGLRGIDPAETRANLDAILSALEAEGVPAVLAGMYAPPNLGRDYGQAFNAIYPELARAHGALLYPFFLDGVATVPALNQEDGIHPNAAGVEVIVARILPTVIEAIEQLEAPGPS